MGFTKIFKMINFSIIGTQNSYTINVPYKDRSGNDKTQLYCGTSLGYNAPVFCLNSIVVNPSLNTTQTSYATFLAIGDGDTPFSEDDYTLANRITSGFTLSADTLEQRASYDNNSGKMIRTIAYTINAVSSITIKELGLFKYVYEAQTSASQVLIYRTVLDNPITLAAGESKTIALSIAGG